MELSKRLRTVAMAVTPGSRLADVGTDHGYIPIALVEKGICPMAIAMDVNKGPLERARENIAQNHLEERITTRLSDGLQKLKKGEADSVVIAGMGGDLICRLLGDSPLVQGKGTRPELILQPQSEWFKVRHWLHDHFYHIEAEWFLEDEKKYYVVIKAIPKAQEENVPDCYDNPLDYVYGRLVLEEKNDTFMAYLKKEADKRQSIVEKMKQIPNQKERVKDLEKEMEEIQTLLLMGQSLEQIEIKKRNQ